MTAEPTPMGTPVPVTECPHCFKLMSVVVRTRAGSIGRGPEPSGSHLCPHCHGRLWLGLVPKAPLGRPVSPPALDPHPIAPELLGDATPQDPTVVVVRRDKRYADTERLRKP
jgi:hypothetical protein